MTKFNQYMLVEAKVEEEKKKKKDGLGQVFELMKALTELQKQIEDCKESQEDPTAIEKIKVFDKHIDDMYQTLMDLAKNGVMIIRKRNDMSTDMESLGEAAENNPALPDESNTITVQKPTSPKM